MPHRPLLIGYGNPLREDDGIGWRAAETIEARTVAGTLDILKCHQLTPELSVPVSEASLVLFLDAAKGVAPGRADCIAVRPEAAGAWTHHLTPGQLTGMAEKLTGEPPCAYLITGGIQRMGWNECLTPSGAAAVECMVERALELIRQSATAA
jgi:hydrogenase maturation protease